MGKQVDTNNKGLVLQGVPVPGGEGGSWHIATGSMAQLSDLLAANSGADIDVCYQCRRCASGCPVAYAMDYTPVQLLHAARLGLLDLVLGSSAIWLCNSCATCVSRCPQEVDIVKIMDVLRAMALETGSNRETQDVVASYRAVLWSIRLFGRVYELGMVGAWQLTARRLGQDLRMGLDMRKRGRLKILPSFSTLGRAAGLFSRARRLERP